AGSVSKQSEFTQARAARSRMRSTPGFALPTIAISKRLLPRSASRAAKRSSSRTKEPFLLTLTLRHAQHFSPPHGKIRNLRKAPLRHRAAGTLLGTNDLVRTRYSIRT